LEHLKYEVEEILLADHSLEEKLKYLEKVTCVFLQKGWDLVDKELYFVLGKRFQLLWNYLLTRDLWGDGLNVRLVNDRYCILLLGNTLTHEG
jgi:hypothetical protein